MYIECIDVRNFRKLKFCRIELAKKETIFVGANNSGKTSAMDALSLFLNKNRRKAIATTDFTLSNWTDLNLIGQQWVAESDDEEVSVSIDEWLRWLPSIDVWVTVDGNELHRISHLIPTLDWSPVERLGVRLVFAPKNIEELYKDFHTAFKSASAAVQTSTNPKSTLSLWPISIRDFLDKQLHNQFAVQSYIIDPSHYDNPEKEITPNQLRSTESRMLNQDPFDGLIKIDVISAQRGFSDPKTEGETHSGFAKLSTQLRGYFSKHLNPSETPDASDVVALEAIEEAKNVFNKQLMTSFTPAIKELEGLNYPGFSDPKISISSNIDPRNSLDHEAAVQFDLPGTDSLVLPEQYNGLGYQNLISMVFSLIRFRDEWMRVGKAASAQEKRDTPIELLHLVLVEEPEAHLHVQVQQVFVKKAYKVLTNFTPVETSTLSANTQLIVSTHSPHIAHELDFSYLRYFRREPMHKYSKIPVATVINLSQTFGNDDETSKFATRYLRITHCELFFADAAILVEGSAERILIPHFVQTKFPMLDQSYIAVLEIGGAHAHRLRPLLDTLGLPSLIITDLDSIDEQRVSKVQPERNMKCRTGNTTLKDWVPGVELLDELLDLADEDKQTDSQLVRVAYQCPISVKNEDGGRGGETLPYTFEDSLALTNIELFQEFDDSKGLLKKLQTALKAETLEEASKSLFDNVNKGSKAEMALELLYLCESDQLKPPAYIEQGLKWLENKLEANTFDTGLTEGSEVIDA